jgi:hypothetical protein
MKRLMPQEVNHHHPEVNHDVTTKLRIVATTKSTTETTIFIAETEAHAPVVVEDDGYETPEESQPCLSQLDEPEYDNGSFLDEEPQSSAEDKPSDDSDSESETRMMPATLGKDFSPGDPITWYVPYMASSMDRPICLKETGEVISRVYEEIKYRDEMRVVIWLRAVSANTGQIEFVKADRAELVVEDEIEVEDVD